MERKLTYDPISCSPFKEQNAKLYVMEGLKMLKRNGFIDQLDYNIVAQKINIE